MPESFRVTSTPVTAARLCSGRRVMYWYSSASSVPTHDASRLDGRSRQIVIAKGESGQELVRVETGHYFQHVLSADVGPGNTAVIAGNWSVCSTATSSSSSPQSNKGGDRIGVLFANSQQVLTACPLSLMLPSSEQEGVSILACSTLNGNTPRGLEVAIVVVRGSQELLIVSPSGATTSFTLEARAVRASHGRTVDEIVVVLANGAVVLCGVHSKRATQKSAKGSAQTATSTVDNFHDVVELYVKGTLSEKGAAIAVQAITAGKDTVWVARSDGYLYAYRIVSTGASDSRASTVTDRLSFFSVNFAERVFSNADPSPVGTSGDSVSRFPIPVPDGALTAQNVMLWSPSSLTPLSEVENRRGSCVYYVHQQQHSVQCGSVQITLGKGGDSPLASCSSSTTNVSGCIYDFEFSGGHFQLLMQSTRRSSPLQLVAIASADGVFGSNAPDVQMGSLSSAIMCASVAEMPDLRSICEQRVRAFCTLRSGELASCETVDSALNQLLDLQHCAMALFRREGEFIGSDVPAERTVSHQLLSALQVAYVQLCAFRLMHRLRLGDKCTVTLTEAFNTQTLRRDRSAVLQTLRQEFNETLHIDESGESQLALLDRWGGISSSSSTTLCLDILLARLGYANDSISIESVIRATTSVHGPEFILFLSYVAGFCVSTGSVSAQVSESSLREFAEMFGMPAALTLWGRVLYVADHGTAGGSVPSAPNGLSGPPFLELLPATVSGLVCHGEYNALYTMTPSLLTTIPTGSMPDAVGSKLAFLAYLRGNAELLVSLHHHSAGTTWRGVSSHALALAAQEVGSVDFLEGVLERASPEEAAVEMILKRGRSADGSLEVLLLEFYILMNRYEDAAGCCKHIALHDSAVAQRVQVVLSCLRSLIPRGVEERGGASDVGRHQRYHHLFPQTLSSGVTDDAEMDGDCENDPLKEGFSAALPGVFVAPMSSNAFFNEMKTESLLHDSVDLAESMHPSIHMLSVALPGGVHSGYSSSLYGASAAYGGSSNSNNSPGNSAMAAQIGSREAAAALAKSVIESLHVRPVPTNSSAGTTGGSASQSRFGVRLVKGTDELSADAIEALTSAASATAASMTPHGKYTQHTLTSSASQMSAASTQPPYDRIAIDAGSVETGSSSLLMPMTRGNTDNTNVSSNALNSNDNNNNNNVCTAILTRNKIPCGRTRPCEYHDRPKGKFKTMSDLH